MADKAFIFDMDGVIIDSEPLHARAKNHTLQEYGMDLDVTQRYFDKYVGRNSEAFFSDLAKDFPEKNLDWRGMVVRKHEIYKKILAEDPDIDAIKGVRELLARLKEHGYKMAIGSSARVETIRMILTRFGILDYFQSITGGNEVAKVKPAPDIYLLAAERLGVAPADCTVVEDANAGLQAAKAAGMRCIAIYNPHSGQQDLSIADQLIHDYAEIEL